MVLALTVLKLFNFLAGGRGSKGAPPPRRSEWGYDWGKEKLYNWNSLARIAVEWLQMPEQHSKLTNEIKVRNSAVFFSFRQLIWRNNNNNIKNRGLGPPVDQRPWNFIPAFRTQIGLPSLPFCLIWQWHLTTFFGKISVRRSKYCLELSINSGRIKISRWPFHSCSFFEAFLTN